MNCFDCLADQDVAVPAVGICSYCGAALCAEHVQVAAVHRMRTVPVNREVPVEPPARLLLCPTCAAARRAAELIVATQGGISRVR